MMAAWRQGSMPCLGDPTTGSVLLPIAAFLFVIVTVGVAANDCDRDCPEIYRPICASDITYANWCFLEIARCRDHGIRVQYYAECDCSESKTCDTEYKPLCGTDKNDYENMCKFEVAKACRKNFTLEIAHQGPCKPDPSDPLCRSDQACPAVYAPVCGSDGRTYGNECGITAANVCRLEENKVTVVAAGKCPQTPGTWMWIAIIAIISLILVIIVCACLVRSKKRSHSRMTFEDGNPGVL